MVGRSPRVTVGRRGWEDMRGWEEEEEFVTTQLGNNVAEDCGRSPVLSQYSPLSLLAAHYVLMKGTLMGQRGPISAAATDTGPFQNTDYRNNGQNERKLNIFKAPLIS